MSGSEQPWYSEFFNYDFLNLYGKSLDPARTAQEVDFMIATLGLTENDRILDLCCGQGRHSLELSRRGFKITGQDLSEPLLQRARKDAKASGLNLQFIHSDMRCIPFSLEFHAIVNMFSSFGYLESREDDLMVLQQISHALKPGGKIFLDLLNREWVLSNHVQDEWRENANGEFYLEHREFDLAESVSHITFTVFGKDGSTHESVGHHIRLYSLPELIGMLKSKGLYFDRCYGGFDGEPYSMNSRRMIVVAGKE